MFILSICAFYNDCFFEAHNMHFANILQIITTTKQLDIFITIHSVLINHTTLKTKRGDTLKVPPQNCSNSIIY